MYLFIFIGIICFMSFCVHSRSYMKCLINLEFIFVTVVLMMSLIMMNSSVSIYLLIFGVCEGLLGICSLVVVFRFYGVDYYSLIDFNF